MNKILTSILLFILILGPGYSSEKIVYLDVEKIMQQSTAGKSIIAQIKKKRESSISKFKKKEKDISQYFIIYPYFSSSILKREDCVP